MPAGVPTHRGHLVGMKSLIRLSETLCFVCNCACPRACLHVAAKDNFGRHSSDAVHLSLGRQDLSLTRGSQTELPWLASEPSCLTPERELQARTTVPGWCVSWALEIQSGLLRLQGKH